MYENRKRVGMKKAVGKGGRVGRVESAIQRNRSRDMDAEALPTYVVMYLARQIASLP